jgi:hypothetical protein
MPDLRQRICQGLRQGLRARAVMLKKVIGHALR